MHQRGIFWRSLGGHAFFCFLLLLSTAEAVAQAQTAKVLGTVNSVSRDSIVVTADDGKQTTVVLADSTRIVRASPGETQLKNAAPASPSEIQAGDRLLARGQSGDQGTLRASLLILMKKSDIAERQTEEREQWRRGVGGIVKGVNAAAKAVTITNALESSGKPIVIHISAHTTIRRYTPDSVKFEDSTPGTLNEIKPGDQLRARGTRSAEGAEFAAQAIVSGTFRGIAGTIVSVDQSANSITVMDLAAKTPATFKISAESDLRKLPAPLAQMIASKLKSGSGPAGPPTPTPGGLHSESQGRGSTQTGPPAWQGPDGAARGANRSGDWRDRPTDLQQMLSRLPSIALADLQKGQAVMLVSTEGTASSRPTAIKILAGVEPILTAAPSPASASSILSPWNLGPPAGSGDLAVQ